MSDPLLHQFQIEGRELVAAAGAELGALAAQGADPARLDALFRHLHTLKGSAALFDLPALTAMLHAAETTLDGARRAGRLDAGTASRIAGIVDLTDAWLDGLESAQGPDAVLIERTRVAAQVLAGDDPRVAFDNDESLETTGADVWAVDLARQHAGPCVAVRYRPAADAYFRGEDPLATIRALPGLLALRLATPPAGPDYDPFQCALEIDALSLAPIDDVRAALRFVADEAQVTALEAAVAESAAAGGGILRSMRVDARRLDELAALVDELVVARNGMARGAGADGASTSASAALQRVVSELHAAVTELRLTPLGPLFARFPRQVRELAQTLGKDVAFEVSGEQVAVDKGVVEGLFAPLLHLIRNALDHGVEAPQARRAAGKSETAKVSLGARAHGDEVVVEVADDGRGVDVARIRDMAVGRGVLSENEARRLSDAEAEMLIFAPGFSTAAQVSDLSGRGVGMDAVRTAVADMGGRISLDNRPGEGLTVRLSLPARVVLTKVLVIEAGGERFGAPLESVAETHRVRAEEIEPVRAGRAYVRRGQVIPVLRLTDLLGLPAAVAGRVAPVLTIDAGGERVGVEIDAIGERIEAPLRPMSGPLSGYPGILGAVMQANGQVLLVLDLAALAQGGVSA